MAIAVGRFYLHHEKGDTQKLGFFTRISRLSLQVASRNPIPLKLKTQHHDRCWASYFTAIDKSQIAKSSYGLA
jgi:hypothetical protein